MMKCVLTFLLPGFFYPVAQNNNVMLGKPTKILLDGSPYVLYRKSNENATILHSDICPHAGASFSKGFLEPEGRGGVVCPYHGFVFRNGRFCGIHGSACSGRGGKKVLDILPTFADNQCIYATTPSNLPPLSLPHQPAEEDDPQFTAVRGVREFNVPQQVVTENILDMLHISFVHKFGNRDVPLPRSIQFHQLDDFSGRTTFQYSPRPGTLSSLLSRQKDTLVDVENEYYLPSTTVTRVTVGGKYVKTVVTRAQPIDKDRTRLYWTIYRNFWKGSVGDVLMTRLMETTLQEDISVLKHVRFVDKSPLNLVYDITFLKYRQALQAHSPASTTKTGGCGGCHRCL